MKPVSIELVRQANPVPDAATVVNDAELERALTRVLDTPLVEPSRRDRRVRSRQRRGMVAMVIALLGLTAAALAASGVLSGRAYQPSHGSLIDRNPKAGLGVAAAGSSQLLALRVPDPAGGPPWGMRVLRTTRGLQCVQVGRIVHSQLGVLGQDGVTGNDHRFHVLGADLVQPEDCVTLDAHQRAFMGNDTNTANASGLVFDRSCVFPGEGSGRPLCPADDQRMIAYGLLGPNARSLTYRAAGQTATAATVGPQGAYLIVRRAAARGDTGLATGAPGGFPGAVAITYKNGQSCRAQAAGHCALDGYANPTVPRLHVGRVRVRLAIRRYQRAGKSYANLLVRFRAPVAITAANRAYTLALNLPPSCGGITSYTTSNHNIKRGAPLTLIMKVLPGNCPGTSTAHLRITQAPAGQGSDSVALGPVVASIATFKLKLPNTNGASQPH